MKTREYYKQQARETRTLNQYVDVLNRHGLGSEEERAFLQQHAENQGLSKLLSTARFVKTLYESLDEKVA